MKKRWKNLDFALTFSPLALAGFGIVMIYSASMLYGVMEFESSTYFLVKQIQWVLMGSFLFFFTLFIPYQKYKRIIKMITFGIILLLIGVLIFGKEVNYAKSWYDLKVLSFQPAEVAKLGLIMYLAAVFSKKISYIDNFSKAVVPPLVITSIVLGLVILQPDIGTASIIFLISLSVILSSGIRFRHLAALIGVGVLLLIAVVPHLVTDERSERFTGAYEPFEDHLDSGYQLIQSYVAIGTGGLTGVGLGNSVQKLGYLDHAHTDFILAIVAEELGLVGVIVSIGLLALIVIRGLYIAKKCEDAFGSLLAIGISSMIGIQAFINIGAVSGLLPITGVTLPFLSYGGSSLLVLMVSMGVLNNIAMQVRSQETPIRKRKEAIPTEPRLRSVGQ
ncbi:putative lipid II flippase FtsW [Salirhabdus sp. Marseille-P4669]|uniref:putative lipid II flippase FtsW n=1 Tax=Salirhabdus sp. Marseille-P4669 TaxID=2042310 RepID=UPI000C7DD016|nr:putative lipid II flippase FtsW [Salirhabdus sp. Marseille-P4669]